jgi:ubiquinol-cytochrome c reductase cytochrome b subunit
VLFGALYSYPFIERWIVGDHGERNLLDRPRDQPTRTALGAAGVTFFALLTFAAGDDVITFMFGLSIQQLVYTLRVLVFALPVVVFIITRRLCVELQRADRRAMLHGQDTGDVVSGPDGSYQVRIRRLKSGELYKTVPADPGPDNAPVPVEPTFRRSMAWLARRGLIGWERRHRIAPPSRRQYTRARDTAGAEVKEPVPTYTSHEHLEHSTGEEDRRRDG